MPRILLQAERTVKTFIYKDCEDPREGREVRP